MHHTPLIATIVVGLVLAAVLGAIANRIRISPLVGYLLAGVVCGPFTPGFVADQSLTPELAEIGVILLMFGVGLHFSLGDLLSVKAIAIPGAVAQIAAATLLGFILAELMGWSIGAGLMFGLALSTASTVVLLRALQERRVVDTERGRIAVGWLIVEDIAMVLTLVLLPAMAPLLGGTGAAASMSDIAATFAITIGKVAAFVAIMMIGGRRIIPWLLHYIAHTGSRELFRLSVLAIALGVAYGATELFGVSFALGAFFAGMILSESPLSQRAAQETLPLRDAFAVLFFVSVGMLFDPMIVVRDPLPLLATVLIIVFGKSLAAFFIVRAFGHPTGTALMISASLAQIGEFSFILAGLGVSLQLLPPAGRDLILAGALLSILANPLAFAAIDYVKPWIDKKLPGPKAGEAAAPADAPTAAEPEETEEITPTQQSGHVVLVGFGRVGSVVGDALITAKQPLLVVEQNDKIAASVRERGVEVIGGQASPADIIAAANIPGARWLIVAIPEWAEAGQFVQQARSLNPTLPILARSHSDAETEHLTQLGANTVIMGEREIALAMLALVRPDVAAAAAPDPSGQSAAGGPPADEAGSEPRPASP